MVEAVLVLILFAVLFVAEQVRRNRVYLSEIARLMSERSRLDTTKSEVDP